MFRSAYLAICFVVSTAAWPCVISQTESVMTDPKAHFERAQFVVLGTVVSSHKVGPFVDRVALDVQRAFKLDSAETKMEFLNFMGSDCSQALESGRQYLIFARPQGEAHEDQYMVIGLAGKDAKQVIETMDTWDSK